jgi:hypothetical protein
MIDDCFVDNICITTCDCDVSPSTTRGPFKETVDPPVRLPETDNGPDWIDRPLIEKAPTNPEDSETEIPNPAQHRPEIEVRDPKNATDSSETRCMKELLPIEIPDPTYNEDMTDSEDPLWMDPPILDLPSTIKSPLTDESFDFTTPNIDRADRRFTGPNTQAFPEPIKVDETETPCPPNISKVTESPDPSRAEPRMENRPPIKQLFLDDMIPPENSPLPKLT